jgi:pimeloyl-ACP methyl ester carboxylesterase
MNEPDQVMHPQDILLAGHRIRFWTGGTGPHLLLLHAAWGDAEMGWSNVWNDLAQSFTVIAPDLPGFGRSSAMAKPSLPAMARLLKQLLNELSAQQTIVVGNSFGVSVAIQFSDTYPEAISCLVLVNGGAMPNIPGLMRAILSLPLIKQGFRAILRSVSYSRRTLNRSFVDKTKLPSGFFDRIIEKAPAYSRISFDSIMNTKEPQTPPTVPTLLLWGARDYLAQMKHAHQLKQWIPTAQLVTLNESGHMPQWEQPEEFVAAIKYFAK